jgi:hypothetical protein
MTTTGIPIPGTRHAVILSTTLQQPDYPGRVEAWVEGEHLGDYDSLADALACKELPWVAWLRASDIHLIALADDPQTTETGRRRPLVQSPFGTLVRDDATGEIMIAKTAT